MLAILFAGGSLGNDKSEDSSMHKNGIEYDKVEPSPWVTIEGGDFGMGSFVIGPRTRRFGVAWCCMHVKFNSLVCCG